MISIYFLRRKNSLVAGGKLTEDPNEYALYGVVYLDVVRTTLFMDDLNKIVILAVDVGNAYLYE